MRRSTTQPLADVLRDYIRENKIEKRFFRRRGDQHDEKNLHLLGRGGYLGCILGKRATRSDIM